MTALPVLAGLRRQAATVAPRAEFRAQLRAALLAAAGAHAERDTQ